MEGGGGGEIRAESGRRRLTLLDQMSAIADGRELSGLTLDDIFRSRKRAVPEPPPRPPPPPPPLTIQSGRTLLDIIRDEDPKADSCKEFVGNRDRKSWRNFKDRLKLKRTGSGAAWTSSVHVPTSDILSPSIRSPLSRRNLVRNESAQDMTHLDDTSSQGLRPQISLSRRTSCRFGPNSSFASDPTQNDDASGNNNNNNNGSPPPQVPTLRHQISRRHSTRFSPVIEDSVTDATEPPPPMREGSRRLSAVLAEERSLSAREAVAAQEAAEAAAAAAAAAAETADEAESTAETAAAPEQQVVRMSLMDLLEETDRQMGFVGARYMFDEDEDYEEEIEEDEEDGGVGGGGGGAGGVDQNCCVCMVRHKGAAFIPCGHTFCRLCSRELWVSRGNCPLCNGFILEILDIF